MTTSVAAGRRRALEEGRRTVGDVLRSTQRDLRKVFVVFLVGFLGAFYALRLYVWTFLKDVTVAGMNAATAQRLEFIAQTPFDVVLLQAKLSMLAGAALALPLLVYYGRGALKARGVWPRSRVPRWKLALVALVSAALFCLGVVYGYVLFFPMLFRFLASNALSAGFEPTYSIVLWTEFVFLLTLTFGVAAQLPLVLGGLAYAEVVPYQTFREKWRYAVLAIVVVSSMANGSPDPLSMSLVAVPLLALYAVGLGVARAVTTVRRGTADGVADAGAPTRIDLSTLDAAGVRAAPASAFADLSESDAVRLAGAALHAGDHVKARALLDRFDAVRAGPTAVEVGATDDGTEPTVGEGTDADPESPGSLLAALASGERDPDDVGGYYADIAFVLDSVTSRSFRVAGTFMAVLGLTFTWLYTGGLGDVRRDFLARLPADVHPVRMSVVTLHPVEALVFEMKVATLVAALATLPVVAYYAWPALRERGFVRGRRPALFAGLVALLGGLVGGVALGYAVVAPAVVSSLVADAVRANMVVSYRISAFFWLVILTTAGVGLLADVPILMVLLNAAGVPYRTMRDRWREVTVAVAAAAAVFTPADVFTMFLATVPLMAAYGVGLAALFVLTLGGRRDLGSRPRAPGPREGLPGFADAPELQAE